MSQSMVNPLIVLFSCQWLYIHILFSLSHPRHPILLFVNISRSVALIFWAVLLISVSLSSFPYTPQPPRPQGALACYCRRRHAFRGFMSGSTPHWWLDCYAMTTAMQIPAGCIQPLTPSGSTTPSTHNYSPRTSLSELPSVRVRAFVFNFQCFDV